MELRARAHETNAADADENENHINSERVAKKKSSAFKQQRLKACQPVLTPGTVIPLFFIMGAIFVPVGIGIFVANEQVNQLAIDYTHCKTSASNTMSPLPADYTAAYPDVLGWKYDPSSKNCTIKFKTNTEFKKPVYVYYRLTNFYQNHRRYVKSFDAAQLKSPVPLSKSPSDYGSTCSPLFKPDEQTIKDLNLDSDAQIYPCGLIANSLFSDLISLSFDEILDDSEKAKRGPFIYQLQQNDTSWSSDQSKYGDVDGIKSKFTNAEIPKKLVPPPKWRSVFPQWKNGYTADNLPNLKKWDAFQIWMRIAGLPNFRKLYAQNTAKNLPAGTWQLEIHDSFDVTSFGGTKSIIISTNSFIGGKNPFLGFAYIVVGGICILLGLIFLLKHMIKPRKLGDHNYLSWNQTETDNKKE